MEARDESWLRNLHLVRYNNNSTRANGNRFEGLFANGVRSGEGKMIYARGKEKKGIWKDDKFQK